MNLPHQRKVAFGVLGLALTALVVDRTVLGPGDATAATPAPSAPVAAAPAGSPAPAGRVVLGSPAPRASARKLDTRLKVATGEVKWSADEVVESLRKSPSWAGEGATSEGAQGDSFRQKHELKAIMASKGSAECKRIALIGGRPLSPGETLDGYTLVSVGARSAVFESGSSRVVLTLKGLPAGEPEGR